MKRGCLTLALVAAIGYVGYLPVVVIGIIGVSGDATRPYLAGSALTCLIYLGVGGLLGYLAPRTWQLAVLLDWPCLFSGLLGMIAWHFTRGALLPFVVALTTLIAAFGGWCIGAWQRERTLYRL